MNILQVTEFPVFPPTSGGDHRKHGLLLSFPSFGDNVHRFSQNVPIPEYGWPSSERVDIDDGYVEHRYRNPLMAWHQLTAAVDLPYVFGGTALRLREPPLLASLRRRADVVLVEEPWQLPAVARYTEDTPLVLDSHNPEAKKFEDAPSPGFVDRLALRRIRRLERNAVDRADAIIVTCQRDEAVLRDLYDVRCPMIVAPNGTYRKIVDGGNETARDDRVRQAIGLDENVCLGLFVGSSYGPNVDAARQVIEVAAECRRTGIPFHAVIVGSVRSRIESSAENVTLAGFVDDIEPYFDAADVALNPVQWGGGTNVKMIDYMARGLPVISTPFGARGFDVRTGEQLLVRDMSAFSDGIRLLAADEELRARMSCAAREYVAENHVWESVSSDLRGRLHDLWSSRWSDR